MKHFNLFLTCILLACFTTVSAQEANTVFVRSFGENLYKVRMVDDFQNNRIVAAQWTVGSGQGVTNPNVFIEKYNSQNALQWGMSTLYESGSTQATLVDLAVDEGGSTYVLINYRGGTAELNGVSFEGSFENDEDFFLAKISPSGNVLWVLGAESENFMGKNRRAKGISMNNENEIIITGDHHRNFTFGGTQIEGAGSDENDSHFDYPMSFVLKVDSDGNGLMSKVFHKLDYENVAGFHGPQTALQAQDGSFFTLLDLRGSVELNGDTINPTSAEGELTKAILKTDENFQNPSLLTLDSPEDFDFVVSDFILDNCGEPVIAGTYTQYLVMGDQELSSTLGNDDVFVSKLSIDNEVQWLQNFGTTEADGSAGLDVNDQNQVFFAMEYFGEYDYADEPYTPGGYDVAVFKLDDQGEFVWEFHSTGDGFMSVHDLSVMQDNTIGLNSQLNGMENLGGATLQEQSRMILSTWVDNDYSGEPVDCSGVVSVEGREKNQSDLTVYPNPAENFINVRFAEEMVKSQTTIQIFNSHGQHVRTENLNGQSKIDISSLSSGLYILKVDGPENTTKRFMKR
ncbi:T9SS type A sorting domain-containing protein [Halocola ammonii]